MFVSLQPHRWSNRQARLVIGSAFIALALGVLVLDQWWSPWYPCLALTCAILGLLASCELHRLLPEPRPRVWWMHLGVVAILLANWITPMCLTGALPITPWAVIAWTATGVLVAGFFVEMSQFHQPNGATHRLACGALAVFWLGLAPSFLLQLRWFGTQPSAAYPASDLGLWALAFGIFVPKAGDIAAYFTGSLFGRHPLAPVLSPKKTWEGAVGGLLGSLVTGWALSELCSQFSGSALLSRPLALFAAGIVGAAAQFSDLAESLIKRDRQVKDTSAYLPGLGGILDTLDSLLFSAPVTWLVLHIFSSMS